MIKAVIFDIGGVIVNTASSPQIDVYRKEIKINKEVQEIITKLKELGYKLAIVSNTIPKHAKYLKEIGAFNFFDVIVLSYEVNLRKPDKEIYQLALKKLNSTPQEVIVVDDEQNYLPTAKELGIKTFLFKSASKLKGDLISVGTKI